MTGRRSHPRYAVASPWDGSMRVLRDVILHRTAPDELLAVSHAPAVAGEEMSLDVIGGGSSVGLRVKVAESRPVIVEGSVRHRIRLLVLEGLMPRAAEETSDEAAPGPALAVEAV